VGVVSHEWKVTHKAVIQTFKGVMVDYPVDDPGAYRVLLTVRDGAGNEDTQDASFNVPPEATRSEAPGWLVPAMVATVAVAVLAGSIYSRRRYAS
jgi:hypothetical protein